LKPYLRRTTSSFHLRTCLSTVPPEYLYNTSILSNRTYDNNDRYLYQLIISCHKICINHLFYHIAQWLCKSFTYPRSSLVAQLLSYDKNCLKNLHSSDDIMYSCEFVFNTHAVQIVLHLKTLHLNHHLFHTS
jgi:hypothetical protein